MLLIHLHLTAKSRECTRIEQEAVFNHLRLFAVVWRSLCAHKKYYVIKETPIAGRPSLIETGPRLKMIA
jgi:hypothetical protein